MSSTTERIRNLEEYVDQATTDIARWETETRKQLRESKEGLQVATDRIAAWGTATQNLERRVETIERQIKVMAQRAAGRNE